MIIYFSVVLVHGTWVSGKKVEPGVQVDLNEGDIVQLGGSSRRYMLHWVPMSRAYNLDVPFVPPMDVLMTVKEAEELSNQVSFKNFKVKYLEMYNFGDDCFCCGLILFILFCRMRIAAHLLRQIRFSHGVQVWGI